MRFKSWNAGVLVFAMAAASPALAQVNVETDQDRAVVEVERMPVQVGVNFGVNNFTGAAGDLTGTGALLGVNASVQPWRLIGVELGYEGSRNPVDGTQGGLWRHNVGALAKVGPTLGQNQNIHPFVGAGVGLSYINPSGDAEDSFRTDYVSEVPLALGVETQLGPVNAGVRATYRILGADNFTPDPDANSNLFNASLMLGGRF
ncbi:outer membrane beta-barrel protein [Archangium violaceum]|uniref:outer membrane beta-barrel protein n=1 Tax=Archangium violaceum TaxID=83451 RepID=UPI00193C4F30|nr:outer membrane beta-barrel protein [Archangium violaceum]QRK13224.1 outer membrane beta-barrel protein [Archangium violaceum]